MYLGIQVDSSDYYEQEEPYIENQFRYMVEGDIAYCTARTAQSSTVPGDDTPEAIKFASNLEKAMNSHSEEFNLRGLTEIGARQWFLNQSAWLMLEFDPDHGEHGEVIPRIVPADEVVVDKYTRSAENPGFVAVYETHSVEDLISRFPEKRKEILTSVGRERATVKALSRELVVKKVFFTYYDAKLKPQEAVAVYYDELLLAKYQDPNWLRNRPNFLKAPMKPIIPLSVISDGKHYLDFGSFVDDAIVLQKVLNNRGRQISLNADRSNGTPIINAKASGLRKEDAENWTRSPGEMLYLKRAKDGVALKEMVDIIPGVDMKQFVIQDKQDVRAQMGVLMGVPIDQTGSDLSGDDPTLGETLIKKNVNNARMDMIVRAIDRWMYQYYNLLAQMMYVWYTEDHFYPYLDSDGSFERLIIKQYYFDEGMRAGVKEQSTIAFDKNREQSLALHLAEKNQLSLLDVYRILGFENPQKLYDNWVKQQKSPFELARDANEDYDESEAYAEFLDIINGKDRPEKRNISREYILTLRKLMLDDKFLDPKLKSKYRNAFIKRINDYLDKYELKTSLDQLGQEDMQKIAPGQQVPPPMPEQQFTQMMNPQPMGMPPGMQPPPQGPPQGPPMQPPMPFGSPPTGGPPQGIFNGTPLQNPARPQTPNGLASVPAI
jgi:hypothetical protein